MLQALLTYIIALRPQALVLKCCGIGGTRGRLLCAPASSGHGTPATSLQHAGGCRQPPRCTPSQASQMAGGLSPRNGMERPPAGEAATNAPTFLDATGLIPDLGWNTASSGRQRKSRHIEDAPPQLHGTGPLSPRDSTPDMHRIGTRCLPGRILQAVSSFRAHVDVDPEPSHRPASALKGRSHFRSPHGKEGRPCLQVVHQREGGLDPLHHAHQEVELS